MTCPVGLVYAMCAVVEFLHSKVHVSGLPKTWFPVTQATWSFTTLLDKPDGSKEKNRVTRSQLPIQPAFAVTGHSAQGKTLPKVMVDLSEGGFGAYVAASLEHNTYIQYGVRVGDMVPVPDAEADRSVKSFTPKPKFDLDTRKPSGVSTSTKRKASRADYEKSISDMSSDATAFRSKRRIRVDNNNVGKHVVSRHRLLSLIPQSPLSVISPSPPSAGVNNVQKSFVSEYRFPSPNPQAPPSTGCRWSSTNWSCAYDSAGPFLCVPCRR